MESRVDIVVRGRRAEVPDRFRQYTAEKLSKLNKLDGKVITVDVEVSKERNPRLADQSDRVEITLRSRGPVVRAEASAGDMFAALDVAATRLEARLKRAADRRRVHHGSRTPTSVARATASLPPPHDINEPCPQQPTSRPAVPDATAVSGNGAGGARRRGNGSTSSRRVATLTVEGDGPLIVREKTHEADPMDLGQALYEMELVGHDFFLFVDADTELPSVVYRRRGYDYGVLRLKS
jgi:ribosomal subunit interface protein